VKDVGEVAHVFSTARAERIEPGAVPIVPGAGEVDHRRELAHILRGRGCHHAVPPLPRGERPDERAPPVARVERAFFEEVDGPGHARKNARTYTTVNDETARSACETLESLGVQGPERLRD